VSTLPLAGRRVLVTRAPHQAGKLNAGLQALGAEPVEVPVLEIVPPESYAPLDDALRHLDRYDWLILASANAARAMAERAVALKLPRANPSGLRVAAVGSATAEEARKIGLRVDFIPPTYTAESLSEGMSAQVTGERILIVRAVLARDILPDGLRAAGGKVDIVDAYSNQMPETAPEQLRLALDGGVDAATFTSSSSATHLAEAARAAGIAWPFAGVPAVSIGPITSQTLRDMGWEPAVEANPHDISGLVAAVLSVLVPSDTGDAEAIHTARLRLVPASPETHRLELDDTAAFAAYLGVSLPQDWPPGEYDRDAIRFFLEKMISGGPEAVGWWGWYAILEGSKTPALVGCGGYLGPPNESGCVEIGYSICEQWRGQGLAKELVLALVNRAWVLGANRVIAHTIDANPASIAVLLGCGFRQALRSESDQLQFEIENPIN